MVIENLVDPAVEARKRNHKFEIKRNTDMDLTVFFVLAGVTIMIAIVCVYKLCGEYVPRFLNKRR